MATRPLTDPLVPGGPLVEWVVHDEPGGRSTTLLQTGAHLFDPAGEVVPFLQSLLPLVPTPRGELVQHPDRLPALPVPVGRGAGGAAVVPVDPADAVPAGSRPPVRRTVQPVTARPVDPLAHLLWLYWPEVYTPDGLRRDWPRHTGKVGVRWELWWRDTGGVVACDAAFRGIDHAGVVLPGFDVDRRPLADLPHALTATADFAKLLKMF